jgi:phosphatidylglycerophosphate synthase
MPPHNINQHDEPEPPVVQDTSCLKYFDHGHDTWVNRLAALLAKGLARTSLSPDHLSWLGLGFGLAAGVLFALGGQAVNNAGAVMFMLAVFMDELDGALARGSGRVTRFGHLLDYIAGTMSFCALFIGAGIGARQLIGTWGPILGVMAAVAALLSMRIRMGMEDRHGSKAVSHKRFGPFELKDGIYLVGPVTWVGGLYWFFVAATLGTFGFALWTLSHRKLWLKSAAR